MKKFKNKKTGEEVKEWGDGFYQDVNFDTIPQRFIEDSDEWEEIIEKDYEILSYYNPNLNSVIFRLCKDGEYRHNSTLLSKGHGCLIHSVKRLSDGEIFTIGDKVDVGLGDRLIEGFRVHGGVLFVDHNKGVFTNDRYGSFKDAQKIGERKERPSVDKYTYKGKTYVILEYFPMKDKSSREWLDAVKYIQLESGLTFCREKEEFFKHFKLVK